MTVSSILDFFRDAPWLTRRRLVVDPKLFLLVYVVSAVVWMLRSKGLIDPAGHPIGADFLAPWAASWLALHHDPAAPYDVPHLWATERLVVGYPSVGFVGFPYPCSGKSLYCVLWLLPMLARTMRVPPRLHSRR